MPTSIPGREAHCSSVPECAARVRAALPAESRFPEERFKTELWAAIHVEENFLNRLQKNSFPKVCVPELRKGIPDRASGCARPAP